MKKTLRPLLFFLLISSAFSGFADEKNEGKRWALIIGINDYQDRFIEPLSASRYDAKLVEDTLKNEGKFDIVIRMTDDVFHTSPKFPSKKNISKVLKQISNDLQENDNFLLYFSGYTIKIADNETHLITADSNLNNLEESSLSLSSISNICTEKNLSDSIFFIDSYKLMTSININHLLHEDAGDSNYSQQFPKIHVDELSPSSLVFHAFSKKNFAANYKQSIYAPYSIFAYYLCEALRGAADFDNDNIVSINDLISFVKQKIISWTLLYPEQSILTDDFARNFDFQFPIGFVPLLARPIFDPFQIDTSFYYQNLYFRLVNYISLGSFLSGLTIFAAGITVCFFGLSQIIGNDFTINNVINTVKDLFTSYGSIDNDLVTNGFFTAAFGAIFTLISFVPYFFSFHFDLNKTHNFEFSLVTGVKDSYFRVGISMKTKKI